MNKALSLVRKSFFRASREKQYASLSLITRLARIGFRCDYAVDVGAHKGGWTIELLSHFPESHVILVEPQTDFLELLRLRDSNPKVHVFQCGAAPSNGKMLFRHHARSDSSSFSLDPRLNSKNEELINVRRIDSLIVEAWGEGVFPQLLKIDAEGFDLEVLEGASKVIRNIPVIIIEAGITNRFFRNSLLEVQKKLDELGFDLIDVSSAVKNPTTGFDWNCDATFVNRNFFGLNSLFRWDGP
jgi:FkbM family methyltransferase